MFEEFGINLPDITIIRVEGEELERGLKEQAARSPKGRNVSRLMKMLSEVQCTVVAIDYFDGNDSLTQRVEFEYGKRGKTTQFNHG